MHTSKIKQKKPTSRKEHLQFPIYIFILNIHYSNINVINNKKNIRNFLLILKNSIAYNIRFSLCFTFISAIINVKGCLE